MNSLNLYAYENTFRWYGKALLLQDHISAWIFKRLFHPAGCGAHLSCKLLGSSTHRAFQRVSNNLSPFLTRHEFRASTDIQSRIPLQRVFAELKRISANHFLWGINWISSAISGRVMAEIRLKCLTRCRWLSPPKLMVSVE